MLSIFQIFGKRKGGGRGKGGRKLGKKGGGKRGKAKETRKRKEKGFITFPHDDGDDDVGSALDVFEADELVCALVQHPNRFLSFFLQ